MSDETHGDLDPDPAISGRIAAARRGAGLTQRALADRVGVRLWLVDRWESGASTISADHAKELADATGVSVEWILFGGSVGRTRPHVDETGTGAGVQSRPVGFSEVAVHSGTGSPPSEGQRPSVNGPLESRIDELARLEARCKTLEAEARQERLRADGFEAELARRELPVGELGQPSPLRQSAVDDLSQLGGRSARDASESDQGETSLAHREARLDELLADAEVSRALAQEIEARLAVLHGELEQRAHALARRARELDRREAALAGIVYETAGREARRTIAQAHLRAEEIMTHAKDEAELARESRSESNDRFPRLREVPRA